MDNAQLREAAPKLVLLVDDNQTHQYSLGRHLGESGFEVIRAHTGVETLQLARTQRPDVILLDIHLPDMSGFDVCEVLKSDAETKPIPIIFHSATHDTHSARALAADFGALSFLSYPIDVDHLISVIRGVVARTKANPQ